MAAPRLQYQYEAYVASAHSRPSASACSERDTVSRWWVSSFPLIFLALDWRIAPSARHCLARGCAGALSGRVSGGDIP